MRNKWKVPRGALLLGAMLAACDSAQPTFSAGPAAPAAGLETVTYAFARALGNDDVRTAVRDAMRASLVSEHKLVLQEYVRTQSGQLLLEAAARAAGVAPAALQGQIGTLPELDFYVASRDQRRTWDGNARVAVVASINQDARVFPGFDVSGNPVRQRGRGVMEGVEAVFVLHRAESKFLRVYPQADVPGLVIQDASDGEWGGVLEEKDARGNITTTQYVDMVPGGRLPQVDPYAAAASTSMPQQGLANVTTTGPGIFFTYFKAASGDGVGACEMKFITKLIDFYGATDGQQATHTAGSVECPGTEHVWETRFPPRGRRGATFLPYYPYQNIRVDVYEEDSVGDDYFGSNYWRPGDFGWRNQLYSGGCDINGCYGSIGGQLGVKWYTS
jgi:hypothetical protein